MKELTPEDDLEALFGNLLYNFGQVQKCYDKDEELIKAVEKREYDGESENTPPAKGTS